DVATANTVTASLAPGDFTANGGTLATNYILPSIATGPCTITKATPIVSISFAASPINYDGQAHAATVTVNGVSGALTGTDGTTQVTYTKNTLAFAGTPTDFGIYSASASFTATNANYTNASTTTPASL